MCVLQPFQPILLVGRAENAAAGCLGALQATSHAGAKCMCNSRPRPKSRGPRYTGEQGTLILETAKEQPWHRMRTVHAYMHMPATRGTATATGAGVTGRTHRIPRSSSKTVGVGVASLRAPPGQAPGTAHPGPYIRCTMHYTLYTSGVLLEPVLAHLHGPPADGAAGHLLGHARHDAHPQRARATLGHQPRPRPEEGHNLRVGGGWDGVRGAGARRAGGVCKCVPGREGCLAPRLQRKNDKGRAGPPSTAAPGHPHSS